MPSAKWGIWCLTTKTWVHESTPDNGYEDTDCTFHMRRLAVSDLEEWCLKEHRKDYEIRPYNKTTPPDAAGS